MDSQPNPIEVIACYQEHKEAVPLGREPDTRPGPKGKSKYLVG